MSASEPVPQRIGDAERDQAVEHLREHLAAGRLTPTEFDERLSGALGAKTAGDLEPLFRDLPNPRPGGQLSAAPPPWSASGRVQPASSGTTPPVSQKPERASKVLGIASAAVWPLMIMLCFILGWEYWWLMFIPIAMSSVAGSLSPKPVKERGELEQ